LSLRAVGPVAGEQPAISVAYAAAKPAGSEPAVVAPAWRGLRNASEEGAETYTVKPGDNLWAISERVYGHGDDYPLLIAANTGRPMSDGRLFDERGVIYAGWVLEVPRPSRTVVDTEDGRRVYVVQAGDCLIGVAGRLLGDSTRWREIFELSRDATTPDGRHRLTNPNLIWPDLPLTLPSDVGSGDQQESPADSSAPAPAEAPVPATTAPASSPTVVAPVSPTSPAQPSATAIPTTLPMPAAASSEIAPATPAVEIEPATAAANPTVEPHTGLPAALPVAAVLGALAVGGGFVGLGLARRRPLGPLSTLPESDVKLEEGFAEADPGRDLADHLPGRSLAGQDPVRLLVGLLLRFLHERGDAALAASTAVLTARHGRSSTTLELAAPLAEQARLLALAPDVASVLGPSARAEAELTPAGDVAVRVRGLRRAGLQLSGGLPTSEPSLPELPILLPLGVLADRQEFSVSWQALGHVLVASPGGGGAVTILTSLVAHLAARRTPAELQLRTIAAPRTLPPALLELPQQLGPAVDPLDQPAIAAALSEVRAELDRRLLAGPTADCPELVLVVGELLDLESFVGLLGQVGEQGPACGVRLLAASVRPGGELVQHPLLADFTTRLVQRATDEDHSLALLGTADAAYLGGGGRVLFRSDHRAPVELYAYRAAPTDLDRLVQVMRTRYGAVSGSRGQPAPAVADGSVVASSADVEADALFLANTPPSAVAPQLASQETIATAGDQPRAGTAGGVLVVQAGCESVLPPAREALLEVQCFHGPRVLRNGQEVWPVGGAGREQKSLQLLFFLAAHSAAGVDRDKAAEALLAEDDSVDPGATLRQWRRRVRALLGRLVPDLSEDLFEDNGRTWRLNSQLVRSDVQRFLQLEQWAKSKACSDPEPAYEAMRALYVGDLFDGPAAQPYAWAVAPGPKGTSLVQEHRWTYQEVTRALAERYAADIGAAERVERALELYDELVRLDPTNERLWPAVVRLHARLGDRAGLERTWQRPVPGSGGSSARCRTARRDQRPLPAIVEEHRPWTADVRGRVARIPDLAVAAGQAGR